MFLHLQIQACKSLPACEYVHGFSDQEYLRQSRVPGETSVPILS